MKRWKTLTAALLAAAVLLPTAQAARLHPHPEYSSPDTNVYSPWAQAGVKQAEDLGIAINSSIEDYTVPATRYEFRAAAMSYVSANQEQDFLETLTARYLAEKDEQGEMKLVFQDKPGEESRETDRADSLAYYLGLVDGRRPGYFDPDAQVTRQEAAVMLARAYRVVGKDLPESAKDLPFTDTDQIADWAKDSVAAMYQWGILQGKGDGSFDPQGPFTREQCILTFLRLYENAPVSAKNNNVTPLFTYDQVMETLMETRYDLDSDFLPYQMIHRWDGAKATAIYELQPGIVSKPAAFLFVYKDGRCCFFDIGLCNTWGTLTGSVGIEDGAFSADGGTFTCTATLLHDSVYSYGSFIDENTIFHRAGVYHISVDVETLEVTQTWEPLPA